MGYDFGSDERYQSDHTDSPVIAEKDRRIAELEAALKPFAAVAGIGAPRIKIDPTVDRLWSYYDSRAEHQHEITRAHLNEAARVLNDN